MRTRSLLCLPFFAGASLMAQTPAPRAEVYVQPGPGGVPSAPMRLDLERLLPKLRGDSANANQAALGMVLTPTGSKRDTIGVFVSRVVPNGPAERAGIVEGDRIVSINGADMRVSAADLEDPYTAAVPAHRVRREVSKLTPGAKVIVRVYSGGKFRDVTVIAGKRSDLEKEAPNKVIRIGDASVAPAFGDEIAVALADVTEGMQALPAIPDISIPNAIVDALEGVRVVGDERESLSFELASPEMLQLELPTPDMLNLELAAPEMLRFELATPEEMDGVEGWSFELAPDGNIDVPMDARWEQIQLVPSPATPESIVPMDVFERIVVPGAPSTPVEPLSVEPLTPLAPAAPSVPAAPATPAAPVPTPRTIRI